jgi:DNA-binding transcriptional regulator YiaG
VTSAIVRPARLRNHRRVAASVQIRALCKAIGLAGGRRALAERLGVKAGDIEKWVSGRAELPREALLRVVEIIIDELAPPGDGTEPGDPPGPHSSSAWSPRGRD